MDGQGDNNGLREKVWAIYDYIQDNLYLNRPDIEIKGKKFNSALLLSLLTALSQGKELIIGEPGLGKTTSAEYVCSLVYRFPLGLIWASEVAGHPEQTEEKIIGRPDLGKLNKGEEVVVWSYFTLLPVKIVDEINRLPETKQSMILDGVDRGNWEYLNDTIINEEYCLFATANYQDKGTNTIIAPMVDRFDVIVESRHPGPNLAYLIGAENTNDMTLRNRDIERRFFDLFRSKISYHDMVKRSEDLCDQFGKILKDRYGIISLSSEERSKIRKEKAKIEFDLDANAFLRMLITELSFCYRYGQKRSHENCHEGCHFTGYMCSSIKNCISNRLPISVGNYARAFAWLLGDENVDLEHLMVITPYALAHRIQWRDDISAQRENDARDDPLPIHMAKEALENIHRRYMEQAQQIKNALAVAYKVMEGEKIDLIEGDHPLYWEIKRDLGKEVRI